jgi:Protein of unknown function (DUF998)
VIGIALFGAGIFVTNAILDPTPSMPNSLHTLCGAVVILTFPIAVSLVAGSLARDSALTARPWLLSATALVWLSLFLFFGSIVVSRAIHPNAGRVGPEVFLGWPNRFLVLVYNVWLILVAGRTLRVPRIR